MVSLDQLLTLTSRTFALAIPLLPEPTRTEVTLAYLMFRVADTLEDAENWCRDERAAGLSEFADLLRLPRERCCDRAAELADRWVSAQPCQHAGYRLLLENTAMVIQHVWQLSPEIRRRISRDARRSALGMLRFVSQADEYGRFQVQSLLQLRRYCYVVAGIVGEMLTAIFCAHLGQSGRAAQLTATARSYGEGLQLVNILKDSARDAGHGRCYLPPHVARLDVCQLARQDLERAETYIQSLRDAGAGPGYIAFATLPLRLAHGTLDRVMRDGPGAKLSRAEVLHALDEVGLLTSPEDSS